MSEESYELLPIEDRNECCDFCMYSTTCSSWGCIAIDGVCPRDD